MKITLINASRSRNRLLTSALSCISDSNGVSFQFSTALLSFVKFMTLYPEVAKKAQRQIDDVIGNNRLPTLEDRRRLPYIDCILKEVLR